MGSRGIRTASLAALAAAWIACAAPPEAREREHQGGEVLVALEGDLAPLRAWFHQHADRPRLLLLLSPT